MTQVISSTSSGRRPRAIGKLFVMQNQVFLLGRLCHTPNLYNSRGGKPKVAFRIAVPRSLSRNPKAPLDRYRDSHSDYATVILLGKKARELYAKRLPRGSWVSVRGSLQTWSNGKWEIVAQSVERTQTETSD